MWSCCQVDRMRGIRFQMKHTYSNIPQRKRLSAFRFGRLETGIHRML